MFEQRIRFAVPAGVSGQVREALETQTGHCDEAVLSARYFDTSARDLGKKRISLRLRREAGQWIQTWQAVSEDGLNRIEHNVPLDHGALNLAPFVGRPGAAVLGDAQRAAGLQARLRPRYQLVFERVRGVLSSVGMVDDCTLELALDAGEARAGSRQHPILELGFELLNGELLPMLQVAAQWQQRFDLILQPLSKAEIGDRLSRRKRLYAHRRSRRPRLDRSMSVLEAAQCIIDECVDQIGRDAVAVCSGDYTAQHLSLCRQGLRRLKLAMGLFKGWIDLPPVAILDQIDQLIDSLGRDRNERVFRDKLLTQLYAAGCGPLGHPFNAPPDSRPDDQVNEQIQRLIMRILIWRHQSAGGKKSGEPFSAMYRARLSKRIRRVRKMARGFGSASNKQRHQLLRRVRDLQICYEFGCQVLPRKNRVQLETHLFHCLPSLTSWRELQRATELLYSDALESTDRTALQFARGWVAGRSDVLDSYLCDEMRRVGQVRLPL